MRDDYLLVLSSGTSRREIELSSESLLVRAGTTQRCDIRFRKELFFTEFELEFSKDEAGQWGVTCSKGTYFSVDGVSRLAFKRLDHGDKVVVKYADSNTTMLTIDFNIDFGRERGSYDRSVDLACIDMLTIGGMPNCNLRLSGTYIDRDLITIERDGRSLVLTEQASRYGVMYNGRRIAEPTILKDCDFFSIANFYFYFKDERLYFSKVADIAFSGISHTDEVGHCVTSEYPLFNRNTRIKTVLDTEKIPVLDPPAKKDPPRSNIVVQLLPAIGMLAVVVFLRGSLIQSSSSQGFIIISACSIGIGILASVLGIVTEKRRHKKETKERDEKYRAYIQEKREEVERFRGEELNSLMRKYPSVEEGMALVREFSGDLFDRQAGDDDFLHVRLGLGDREAVKPIDFKEKESFDSDELADLPRELSEEFRYLSDAPICVDLEKANAVGVVGTQSQCESVMNNAVLDLCAHHFANDVNLFFIVEPEHEALIHWLRFVPHVQNEALNCRNIVCDEESKNVLFEYLYKELTLREASKGDRIEPRLVIFVIDESGLKNHPLSHFIGSASSLGVTFIFFERARELLPLGCDQIIFLERDTSEGRIVDTQDDRISNSFAYSPAEEEAAADAALMLAPVYCEEVSLEGALTKNVSLFELFEIIAADDLDLQSRWSSTQVEKSLSAPLGVSKSKTIRLDLHDKAHGPHGLVAGTTGSGKSEILQTYVLSMATLFHPYEVGFVIIDFKGGGMVNQFRDLPHLVGAITNIDGREIDRSLKSIKAELQKRQRCFAEADVNHISNYIKKFKAGEVKEPIPHLIIIVDEFAELKAEQPEFMKELISASRIGRSLGVHLILATQKPAGQVSEQIWSNSRFKLCLKVQSKEDSNEVLKSPLAAEIKEPGRAYLQVGNNEIFELFQSAYSGGPEHEDADNTKEFTLYQVENSGKRIPVFEKKRQKTLESSITQLDAVVTHVARYCDNQGIVRLPSICLPPLPEVIPMPASPALRKGKMAFGVLDDPSSQYQGEALLDIDNANLLVVGASQMGKTNVLQAMIKSIASTRTPNEAVFYILDFASMALKNFESLNHVGGVVLPSEDQKLKNLFKLLSQEMAVRKRRLLEVGVSSFSAYLEADYKDMPHIYVLIDNYAVFKELYQEQYEDALLSISRDGIAYGITVVIANSTTTGFGYKYMANFSTHIALTCNDTSEYSVLFERCRMQPKNVPGRGLCSIDKTVYEFQSYLAFGGERELDRVRAMRDFVEKCNERNAGMNARLIPSIPDDLKLSYIRKNYRVAANELAIALDYETVEPVRINLDEQFSLAVVGKNTQAKKSVVASIMADIAENIFDRAAEVFIVDGMRRDMEAYRDLPYVSRYCSDYSEISLILEEVEGVLAKRYEMVASGGFNVLADAPYLVVVINSSEALGYVSETKQLMDLYGRMAKQYAAMRVLIVFADVQDAAVGYSGPALLKAIKDERRAFLVSNIADNKFFDLASGVPRVLRSPLSHGQAFFLNGADISRVKVADPGEKAKG